MTLPSPFDQMRAIGAIGLSCTKEWFTEPSSSGGRLTDAICRVARVDPVDLYARKPEIYQSLCCNALIAGRWAMSGYPTVQLGHRTAAAFMATKIRPDDAAAFVRCPWPGFGIRIPSDLLTIEDEGILRPVSFIGVTAVESTHVKGFEKDPVHTRWWYKLIAASQRETPRDLPDYVSSFFDSISLWAFNIPTEHLATKDAGASTDEAFTRWDTLPVHSSDERSEQLARSLIMSCCLYLSGDPREREARQGSITVTKRQSKQRESDTLPPYTSYEVQSSIKINLQHAMRDYVRHGGSAPTVQTMAAGHWKRVAYGHGHALRRLQHIEPYWRGPIDAPVSTRVK